MKAIITGATGFLGKWLVKSLLNRGFQVYALIRNEAACPREWKAEPNLNIVYCPLDRLKHISSQLDHYKPFDYFFHFAWEGASGNLRADSSTQIRNIEYSCDAINLAELLGCERYINAGSIMEHDAVKILFHGSGKAGAGSIYCVAKLTSNLMCRIQASSMKIKYISVIISNIYGPGEKSGRFLNTVLRKMIANERIPLTQCDQKYDFIYVSDAINAILTAAEIGNPGESYYIGNSEQRPLRDFIMEMKDVLSSDSILDFGTVQLIGDPLTYNEFDTNKLERDLNFIPLVSFREGIMNTKNWIIMNEH